MASVLQFKLQVVTPCNTYVTCLQHVQIYPEWKNRFLLNLVVIAKFLNYDKTELVIN